MMKVKYLIFLLLLALFSCVTEGERRQMERIIAEADSMNRNYISMTSDSLLLEACRFYDRHGSPNERMRAHYLLGCVYRDRGEAPHAVDTYQDAAACADTTAEDCDFHTLGCIYSQMADVYHKQLLLTNEIDAYKQAIHFAGLAYDTIYTIYNQSMMGGVYILLNKRDSAELIIKDALRQYMQFGYREEYLSTSTILMFIYAGQADKQTELKQLIDNYDAECSFDGGIHNRLNATQHQFFYYKGRYFEMKNQLDSAEYYYRKVYYKNMNVVAQNPMYKGLLCVFQKRHQADSIAKYAQLYCMVNDSSIALKDQQLTAQMAASYNYNFYKHLSLENERNAYRNWLIAIIITIVSVFIILSGIYLGKKYKTKFAKEVNLLKQELEETTAEYEQKIKALQQLEATHKQAINDAHQALAAFREEKAASLAEYDKAQNAITFINRKYEQEKAILTKEIEDLKYRIEELKNYQVEGTPKGDVEALHDTDIVRKLNTLSLTCRSMNSNDATMLRQAFNTYHPLLMNDLLQETKFSKTDITVCLLTTLDFPPAAICNLTGLSSSSVSNIRAKVNKYLFDDKSASTLYKNIYEKYSFCTK